MIKKSKPIIIKKEEEIKMGTLDRTINREAGSTMGNKIDSEVSPDQVKKDIQAITQNATPLGKVLEFLEKDLQEMKEEYEKWDEVEKETNKQLSKIFARFGCN